MELPLPPTLLPVRVIRARSFDTNVVAPSCVLQAVPILLRSTRMTHVPPPAWGNRFAISSRIKQKYVTLLSEIVFSVLTYTYPMTLMAHGGTCTRQLRLIYSVGILLVARLLLLFSFDFFPRLSVSFSQHKHSVPYTRTNRPFLFRGDPTLILGQNWRFRARKWKPYTCTRPFPLFERESHVTVGNGGGGTIQWLNNPTISD